MKRKMVRKTVKRKRRMYRQGPVKVRFRGEFKFKNL